jgi:CRP-like cAMP-binding protein
MVSKAFLKECDIFSGLNDGQLEKLVAISKRKTFAPGTLVFKIGGRATHLFLVEKGKVFLEMKGDMGHTRPPMAVIVDAVTRWEAFGWSSFVEPNIYTLSALTADQTSLISFDGEKLKALMGEDPLMGYEIAKGLSRLMASRLKSARVLLASERAFAVLMSSTEYA